MSKSLGNYVGISEPAGTIFGKLMSISDELMWRYIELLSLQPVESIDKWKKRTAEGGNPRDIKVLFAKEIVTRFHGAAAAEAAAADFDVRFKHGDLPDNIPEVTVKIPGGCKDSNARVPALAITKVLKETQLVSSASEAVRMVEQGGVRINGEKVTDKELVVKQGETIVLQVGKRKFARVTLT
jgi:tyrosyl-tRNA synthetase